jgi:plasmid stabilization system protein ParE
MLVRWTPKAERDRQTIYDFIARDDPDAAAKLDRRFFAAAENSAPSRS